MGNIKFGLSDFHYIVLKIKDTQREGVKERKQDRILNIICHPGRIFAKIMALILNK